jgi:bacterioferritin (cytochrome b1)
LEQKIITFKEENEAQSERKAIAATENDINALKEKYAEILKKSEEQVENLKTSVGKIAVGGSKEFIAENGR